MTSNLTQAAARRLALLAALAAAGCGDAVATKADAPPPEQPAARPQPKQQKGLPPGANKME